MMKLDSYFTEIDSIAFSTRMSLASGLNIFRRFIQDEQVVNELIEQISGDATLAQAVTDHALELIRQGKEPEGYLNFYDEAVAAYAYALFSAHQEAAFSQLQQTISAGSFFWARRLVNQLTEKEYV